MTFDIIWKKAGRSVDIKKDITVVRTLLNLGQEELADKLGVTFESVNRWEMGGVEIEDYNIDKLYGFAYREEST